MTNPTRTQLFALLVIAAAIIATAVYNKKPAQSSVPEGSPVESLGSKALSERIYRAGESQASRPERPGPRVGSRLPPPPPPADDLSLLADRPDWTKLAAFARSRTAEEVRNELRQVYAVSDIWQDYITIHEDQLIAKTSTGTITVPLAKNASEKCRAPVYWDLSPSPTAPAEQPLAGLNIAIDSGHIGGDWAAIEEREFQIGNAIPVREGTMTLAVARHLKPMLEQLGASVTLVRDDLEPVTPYRPDDFARYVRQRYPDEAAPALLRKRRERLFYRTSEIRTRAKLVNEFIQPDLLLCLHFNAESWGSPSAPNLIEQEHFHMLVNGAYTDGEWRYEDNRFELLQRLLGGFHQAEKELAQAMVDTLAPTTGLPAYRYDPNSPRAIQISEDGYTTARNLLANRIYQCPVVFFEPYLMNGRRTYHRIQAGDYIGLRKIDGRVVPSLFLEYAEAIKRAFEIKYSLTN